MAALPLLQEGASSHSVGLSVVPVGPRVFLALAVVLAAALSPTTLSLAVQVAVVVALAASMKLAAPLIHSWKGIALVSASLLIIYSWAYPGSTDFVWVFGVQGFETALFIVMRLLLFVSALYLLLLSVGPLALVRWAGDVNESFGVMLSLTLGIVPAMLQQLSATMQAQQARGLDIEGSLLAKLRAYVAVMIPVVVKSLVRAYDMAALMHVRGFDSGRRVKVSASRTVPVIAVYVAGIVWVGLVAGLRVIL